MNRALYIATLLAVLACGPKAAGQNFSSITSLSNCNGSRTIVRSNQISQSVTCYHDIHDCSIFVVEGNTSKKFATSVYQSPSGSSPFPVINQGYIVHDMEILDQMCWFCGEKWVETGQTLYTPGGLAYPEVLHYGFIGRFNIGDVLSGSGSYGIMVIPNTSILTNLALYSGGVTAIGESLDYPFESCVVELQETSYPNTCIVSKINSYDDLEVFMDVAAAGGKVVTLSRYKVAENSLDSSYFKYCFGLRYGTPSNFLYTANTLYNYRTNKVFSPANIGKFYGLTPIFLTHTNNGNGVVVSYLGGGVEGVNFFHGRLLMAHIASIGASTVDTRMNFDPNNTVKYSEIKEVRFNNPYNTYSKMAVLAKDVNGNSTLRFPRWECYNHDTIMYTNEFNIESFIYYNFGTNVFAVTGTGHSSTNKITKLWQYVNSNWPSWNTLKCMNTATGYIHGDPGYDCVDILNYGLLEEYCIGLSFATTSITTSAPIYFQTCTDGLNILQPLE